TINQIQCKDPKAWVKIGDRLFILTANSVSGGYAPATILVYKVDGTTLTPVKTPSFLGGGNSNAILFVGQFNPVNMAAMSANTEWVVVSGAPSAGEVAPAVPFSLSVITADWCSVPADGGTGGNTGGTGGSDSGTGGTGGAGDGGSKIDGGGGTGGDGGKM